MLKHRTAAITLKGFLPNYLRRILAAVILRLNAAISRSHFLILPVPRDSRPFGQSALHFVRNLVTADCAKYQCTRRFINQN